MPCNNKRGFTIVELMIAMVVFGMASLMTTAIVIGMSRQYQKGTYTAQLNDASRSVHQDIRDAIAYSKSYDTLKTDSGVSFFCAGSTMYYWPVTSPGTPKNGLFKRALSGLPCTRDNAQVGVNLLPRNGFVQNFSINLGAGGLYTITTNFAVGTNDMFTDTNYTECLPTLRGGDFCSIVNYTSNVKSRL